MDEFTLSNILIDHLVLFEAMEAKIIGQFQGYINRYDIIDCEHTQFFCVCFEKRSLIKQQGKFVERFSELMKNLSDRYAKIRDLCLYHKNYSDHLVYQ